MCGCTESGKLLLKSCILVITFAVLVEELTCTVTSPLKAMEDKDEKIDLIPTVSRFFTNQGFHRELSTQIVIHARGSNNPASVCEILIIEDLPRDIYVDVDQLQQNRKYGDPYVVHKRPIDIEKPAHASTGHRIYIFSAASYKDDFIKTNITVPIHLRYQAPSKSLSHHITMLNAPKILIKCADGTLLGFGVEVSAPCDRRHLNFECSWTELPFQFEDGVVLTFKIPLGKIQHTALVTIGTLSSAAFGVAMLLYGMYSSGNCQED